MILVDSTVWIDFFKKVYSKQKDILESLIVDNNQVCISGLILQEVLHGIKDEYQYKEVKDKLIKLPFVLTDKETYLIASKLYRNLREKGFFIPSMDFTIAACAIQNSLPLFTIDKHFKFIAENSNLSLFHD